MPRGIYPRTKEQYRKIGIVNAIKHKGEIKTWQRVK